MKKLLAVVLVLAVVPCGCGRITIPPQLLDCRTLGCPAGGACVPPVKPAESALYRCEAKPPEQPPEQTPVTTPPDTTPPGPPVTTPPEPAEGCTLAGVPTQAVAGHRNALGEAVNAAMRDVTGYDAGRVVVEMSRQDFQAKVEARLRSIARPRTFEGTWVPLCAGQHRPDTDEIAVARSASEPWEAFHVYADNDSRPGTGTVFWSVGEVEQKGSSYRGAWYPPGTAPAEPIEPACPAPRWESFRTPTDTASCGYMWGLKATARWRDKAGDIQHGWDATLNVERCCGFCKEIGLGTMPDGVNVRCNCPLRPEGSPERVPCEAEVGAIWQTDGVAIVNPDNPAQATCSGCSWLRVCTKSGACSEKVKP